MPHKHAGPGSIVDLCNILLNKNISFPLLDEGEDVHPRQTEAWTSG